MEETWVKIEKCPRYEISNEAEVRHSITKRTTAPYLIRREDDLKIRLAGDDNKYHTYSLKRLVAEAFHGGPHDNCDVECIDGNLDNIYADNLTWTEKGE